MNSISYQEKNDMGDKIHEQIFAATGINRFSQRLKEAMEIAGITSNTQLAKRADMSEAVIRKYLKGESYPTLDRLAIIADACHCSVSWLATGDGQNSHENDTRENYHARTTDLGIAEFVAVLSRLSGGERELLLRIIYKNGVTALLNLDNDENLRLLQLPEAVKAGVLRLANRPDTAIREILSKVERDDPPESVADKKAV